MVPLAENPLGVVLKALSDPTRLQIFELLASSDTALSIHAISEKFPISRQGVTKHIRLLHQAALVKYEMQGRERYCFVNVQPLETLYIWINRHRERMVTDLSMLDKFIGRSE